MDAARNEGDATAFAASTEAVRHGISMPSIIQSSRHSAGSESMIAPNRDLAFPRYIAVALKDRWLPSLAIDNRLRM